MRKLRAFTLAAGAGLVALFVTTHQVAAQSAAAAQCEAVRSTCQDKCGPAATGSLGLGSTGLHIHDDAIKCLGKCKRSYDGCARRAGVRDKPATGMSAGDPPQRRPKSSLSGVYDGNSILNNTGPGFSASGPAAAGSQAGGGAPPPRAQGGQIK
jgi:hypothetical protein